MRLTGMELVRVAMPLVRPFRTSFGVQVARDVLLVRVLTDVGEGWGECAAHAEPFYNEEFTEAAQTVIQRWLAPALFALGDDLSGAAVGPATAKVKGYRAAKAGLEMAVLDAELRDRGTSIASHLGGVRDHITVGVSVGMSATLSGLLDEVGSYIDAGYTRVKLKIEPGTDIAPVAAVRGQHPDVALQVDANASYSPDDVDHLAQLDRFDLLMIEQPFAVDEIRSHAQLARRINTPICLDESILSARGAIAAVDEQACSIVNIKVGRVGGLLEAKRIHDACAARSVPVWCGGMLETGIGRAANIALASLPNFRFPGDISASDRYFAKDLTAAFELVDSGLAVPDGPGLGVEIDVEALSALGAERIQLTPR